MHGLYSTLNQIRFKTMMVKSSLCDCSEAYLLISGRITITGEVADDNAKETDKRYKKVIFTNCVPFTKCLSKMNNT